MPFLEENPVSNRLFLSLLLLLLGTALTATSAHAAYGARVCKQKPFKCHKVKKGESWASLFPSSHQREVAERLNRRNTRLRPGQIIAIPKRPMTLEEISPFPSYITEKGRFNRVYVNQRKMAWGAYDAGGKLIKWGPISAGKGYCRDVKGGNCKTPFGSYTAFRKEGGGCESTAFPVGEGGAPMPYCIFFNKGYALHGSPIVPGYNASHGCVRMYEKDARWLNYSFVELGGTKVVVTNKMPKRAPASQYKRPKSRFGEGISSGWSH